MTGVDTSRRRRTQGTRLWEQNRERTEEQRKQKQKVPWPWHPQAYICCIYIYVCVCMWKKERGVRRGKEIETGKRREGRRKERRKKKEGTLTIVTNGVF